MGKYMLILVMPLYLLSQPNYNCKIQKVSNDFYKPYVNESFTVNRETGVMSGTLKNSFFTKPKIIDKGSKENSYKVITTMELYQGNGAGSNVHVLVIEEFVESNKKPFVYLWNTDVYWGECIHD